MKRFFTILWCVLLSTMIFAQAPALMDFQSLVRDANGNFVSNQTIGVQISILKTSATGTVVYRETHSVTTNANGLLTLTIGKGTVKAGTFASIDWSAGPYFLKTEMDVNGGTSYTLTQTTQMMSVPYALYANKAGNVPDVSALEARIAALENAASSSPAYHPDGFSVSPGHQVKFAKGNLTYNSSTEKYGIASTQYSGGTVFNSWRQGTYYVPYTSGDYGMEARTDIGGNWRTLSSSEWGFLVSYRRNANKLISFATVNGVSGILILPDEWIKPSGISFTPTLQNYTTNTYSTTQWNSLQSSGAVFLPKASYLTGEFYGDAGTTGYRGYITFTSTGMYTSRTSSSTSLQIRLVEDYY